MTRMILEWALPYPNFRSIPVGVRLTHDDNFSVHQAKNTADLQWNRVSNLELCDPKVEETLHWATAAFWRIWILNGGTQDLSVERSRTNNGDIVS
ncbi:hypothetical protein AVEN_155096-1 [Araneus ventricosus]|uniref:Uncharacterized protein n=1 Tax=Araneus ventricosus TaxID=182803 RepID=A0A4Y2A7Q6_ARAVE|nr:hypothetical protein AVEN_155096-1 [Araneus ventricosus]